MGLPHGATPRSPSRLAGQSRAEAARRLATHAVDGVTRRRGEHTPVHLARAFRVHFGCSVGEFLRRRRVEWAANALATTEESLAAIAQCAGFCDQSHFTRVFRHVMGMRPGAYRRAKAAGTSLPSRPSVRMLGKG